MKLKVNNRGFAHHLVLIGLVIVLVLGGALWMVIRANNNKSAKSNSQQSSNTDSNTTENNVSTPTLKATAVVQEGTSQKTSTQPSTPATTTATTSNSSSSGQATNSQTASTPTPLSTLTSIVTDLKNGKLADVTASEIDVPAAVSGTVKARPIVFSVNGTTYLAYTRVNPPNFNTSAETTANSMAIVQASGSASLVKAHLDKGNNLVDPDLKLVGYTQSNS